MELMNWTFSEEKWMPYAGTKSAEKAERITLEDKQQYIKVFA